MSEETYQTARRCLNCNHQFSAHCPKGMRAGLCKCPNCEVIGDSVLAEDKPMQYCWPTTIPLTFPAPTVTDPYEVHWTCGTWNTSCNPQLGDSDAGVAV